MSSGVKPLSSRRTFLRDVGATVAMPLFSASPPVDGRLFADAQTPASSTVPPPAPPLAANLVCGGAANDHDIDFARRRLLDALYDIGGVRTEVWRDYAAMDAIEQGDFLVSYTSLVVADRSQSEALRRFIERGGRWFALHASNYVREAHQVPEVLGSRFITHPPYMRFSVAVTRPADPLLDGLGVTSFEVDDELYVMELARDIEVLLHARWGGRGVLNVTVPEADQPIMYRRRVGDGGVLYLALGHSNRALSPRSDGAVPPDRRGSWDTPIFQELVRRGIEWAAGLRPL